MGVQLLKKMDSDEESWIQSTHDEEESDEVERVQVKFITKLEDPKFVAPDAAYFVPITLGRYGLSQLVNHLLELQTPQPFDFLIDDQFLRTTLQKFAQSQHLSTQDALIELEYVLALEAPQKKGECQHDDWISCISCPAIGSLAGYNASASYDGVLRLWTPPEKDDATEMEETDPNKAYVCSLSLSAHSKPVKAIRMFLAGQSKCHILTGSQDHTIKWWRLRNVNEELSSNKFIASRREALIGEFSQHTGSIECLDVNPENDKFISGSFDNTMKVWDLVKNPESNGTDHDPDSNPKRRKHEIERFPLITLEGHVGCVSSVNWVEEGKCVSGSWDHSIRVWDLPSGICTDKYHCGTPIYSLSYNKSNNLILTGHADRTIRLWDPRSKENVIKSQFKSHKAWVPGVQWHPTNSFYFASASHDGTIKVWDSRSSFALHTIECHKDKALCVAWENDRTVVSGGADSKLQVYEFQKLA